MEKIREAKRALEERAREQAKSQGKPEEEAKPAAKMQYNFTDPESRIMKGADDFVQAYNVQVAVEPDFQLIVGQLVTQEANDKQISTNGTSSSPSKPMSLGKAIQALDPGASVKTETKKAKQQADQDVKDSEASS